MEEELLLQLKNTPTSFKETAEGWLSAFDPINLEEMDGVKLLDRTDTKFLFHRSRLPGILDKIGEHYRVLEIKGCRANEYETLYYDTRNFDLYLSHHNDRINRYKIRFRKYVGSDLHFFEIKLKNSKGRTIKSRVQRPEIEHEIKDHAKELLESITNFKSETLIPTFWVDYIRVTFVSRDLTERLTLDINLGFRKEQLIKNYEDLIIAELKQDKSSTKSPFARLMAQERIKENSISKYCFGVTQMINEIKKNNFKPKILTLNKILNGYA